jgi:hypothetical protein
MITVEAVVIWRFLITATLRRKLKRTCNTELDQMQIRVYHNTRNLGLTSALQSLFSQVLTNITQNLICQAIHTLSHRRTNSSSTRVETNSLRMVKTRNLRINLDTHNNRVAASKTLALNGSLHTTPSIKPLTHSLLSLIRT